MGDSSLFDSYLLSQFPGRTLDELDDMDILRYFRALQARKIDLLEDTHQMVISGKKKGAEVGKDEWEEIREHNKMWESFLEPRKE